ncbi:MAG: excinuclease ABC subunit A [Planctomycetaceae bacterium]|nr:excinuclease ABC subunit A [Planctomycetaceae bacterium]
MVLRGIEVHNLKSVNLDIPHGALTVICGVSGSGKTSLALDTLYAEGQRRYIESFSAYARRFLEQLDKPVAESIEGIPPAIAVTRKTLIQNTRNTVGVASEILHHLRVLFAQAGQVVCRECGVLIQCDSPDTVVSHLQQYQADVRAMLVFPSDVSGQDSLANVFDSLRKEGFVRVIYKSELIRLSAEAVDRLTEQMPLQDLWVVVDRFSTRSIDEARLLDSLETAFEKGNGRCALFLESGNAIDDAGESEWSDISGECWKTIRFSAGWNCERCELQYPPPEVRLFSFDSPLGACSECEGTGRLLLIDPEIVFPDRRKTIREGAIAPWNAPAYKDELQQVLAVAGSIGLPVDTPVSELSQNHWNMIFHGVVESKFSGVLGFFERLQRGPAEQRNRAFIKQWQSSGQCPVCQGWRLREEALATQIGERNIAEVTCLTVEEASSFLAELDWTERETQIVRVLLEQIQSRLGFLEAVGLGYLALDRPISSLSGGEAQRVALSSSLGSNLVNMLYVLDEPSVGLHPQDTQNLISAINALKERGNTVVLVEHEEALLRSADQLIEIGPGAGDHGGEVVCQGTLQDLCEEGNSLTGDYLMRRRGKVFSNDRRPLCRGKIRLEGASGHNLQDLTVEFPLGVLCVVTGVSGSGKSTLVQETLFPALCQRKRKKTENPLPYSEVFGDGQIEDVILVDQSPIGRSPRSNPVTYIKAFDEIRKVFAETLDARTHNYTPGHFSFNVDGGRCSRCKGVGHVEIDMQFLADVFMKCSQCDGTRYRQEILAVRHRDRNIAEVLEMTVRHAFSFFRGYPKVQAKLRPLIDVGLDYLRLGQPANTLSAGESQRLKLATYTASTTRHRTLFLLDEPTTGLHFSDVVQLIDCFDTLLSVGHSLVVIEHNLQLIRAADYLIDLGPGAGQRGGKVVVAGTPEEVSAHAGSMTGRFLRQTLVSTDTDGDS